MDILHQQLALIKSITLGGEKLCKHFQYNFGGKCQTQIENM